MSLRVDDCVARIRERNAVLNAILHVLPEPRSSSIVDAPLAGMPYVLKDTWDTAGIPTTGGSYRHRQRVPEVSGRIHTALEDAGAVLLGKSNLCDLSFSSESDNHMRGPVRNPHDPSRTAGGSTGGGAAAVADGMATFDWGTDFGGSIRGPAAFCGVVGLRLSDAVWHVGKEHFPRIPPLLWDFCGMGPLTRDVETARRIVRALRPSLRNGEPDVEMSSSRAVVYAPDRAHLEDWPTFAEDTKRLLRDADVAITIDDELPSPTQVNALYTEYLAAHFGEFVAKGDISLREAIPAVFLGLVSAGRLDKRIHPNTAILLAGIAALGLRHRDRARPLSARARLREAIWRSWSRGALVVTPTCTMLPPRHGRSAFAYRLMSFCKLGNLVDATALALPFGTFATKPGQPSLPRSLQILGPPGSEEAVLDLAARLEERARPLGGRG